MFTLTIIFLIVVQVVINLIGALGPELGFDALWYHLTLPKIYIAQHKISFIPGGLLYYSAMPQLTEMLYTAALLFKDEVLAKIIHFTFGLLSLIVIYKISRKFLSKKLALLAALIFYSNLVVGWISITAYIDLARTFFEVLAFWACLNYFGNKKIKWLITAAFMLGLAISTKLLAASSILIFLFLLLYRKESFRNICLFVFIALLIPINWLLFSFINTGNPVYPFFTKFYPVGFSLSLLNPVSFANSVWTIFLHAADPISPIYLIILPLFIYYFKSLKKEEKIVVIYCLTAFLVWYFTPQTGGGRFILPYLPVFSIMTAVFINKINNLWLKKYLVGIILFIAIISIGYRAAANAKYLPVIFGKESKDDFLTKNLNFSFGDFYDVDGYFKKTIKPTDKVLIYGVHNLYYVDFPFVHESYRRPDERFNYILTQSVDLPKNYSNWRLIYQNNTTGVKLYNNP